MANALVHILPWCLDRRLLSHHDVRICYPTFEMLSLIAQLHSLIYLSVSLLGAGVALSNNDLLSLRYL